MSEGVIPVIARKETRTVTVGGIPIGFGHLIPVQSMTKTHTENWQETIREIRLLENAGCAIVRCAANNIEAAKALKQIKREISIPLVADVHFDHKIALQAIHSGVDKIRINPGNIGSPNKIKEVVRACQDHNVPIRIGINAGSLEKDILKEHGYPGPRAMVASAKRHISILEELNFYDIIISMKSSHALATIEANRLLSQATNYPIHLGVTEAGSEMSGFIKSGVGIGALLAEGIGDTIRVSLTAPGAQEVKAGYEILRSLGYPVNGVNIISCPTCGRLEADLIPIVHEITRETAHIKEPLSIALMGCVVNGPGESKGADIGICAGKDHAVLYIEGESRGMISFEGLAKRLLTEIEALAARKRAL